MKALKSGKMLMKASRKAALFQTESCRLMGIYHWLLKNERGAFNWWHRAVDRGEALGARPQLARSCAEMGIRLCAVKCQSPDFDASRIKEPLQKAKMIFCDMGLDQELEDLNLVIHRTGLEPSEI